MATIIHDLKRGKIIQSQNKNVRWEQCRILSFINSRSERSVQRIVTTKLMQMVSLSKPGNVS